MRKENRICAWVGAAAVAGVLAAPWGCGLVVGAGDYRVGDAGGLPAGCNTARLDRGRLDPILRACALYIGCYPRTVTKYELSDCVTYDYPHTFPQYRCALGPTTCEPINDCRNLYISTSTLDCPRDASEVRCAGDHLITCYEKGYGVYSDCGATAGAKCSSYASGGKTIIDCRLPSLSCSGTSSQSKCSGNTLYDCVSSVAYGSTCSTGFTCKTLGADTSCFSSLAPCGGSPSACTGDVGHYCLSGLQVDVNCGAGAGVRCSAVTDGIKCLINGCSTADADRCTESCAADGIHGTICVGGAPLEFSCKELGFASCAANPKDDKHPKGYIQCVP